MRTSLIQEHVRRTKEHFRKALGRDLTLEEERYIGLSATVAPIDDIHLLESNRRVELKKVPQFA